jgi:hypothetical protein
MKTLPRLQKMKLNNMKTIALCLSASLVIACGNNKKSNSIELITESQKQSSIFQSLLAITNNAVPENDLNDSLSFLILPVQASCPACRKKTIDSIVKYRKKLAPNRFIVISASGGRKTINSYFREEDAELPVIENKLFLDSINQAYKFDLYSDKPTIYYAYNKRVYKKVAAIPATVKEDLREFFSGYRNE